MTIASGEKRLSDEVYEIDQEFPGWHAFVTESGHVWAVTTECHGGGSGTTVDAPTPDLLRHEIAEQQHRWHCGYAA